MSESNIFEQASREKLRFETPRGHVSVEDLWDLPLSSTSPNKPNLDDVARGIHKQLKESEEVSFVQPVTAKDGSAMLGFEVVKHIIAVKMAERDAARLASDKAAQKQKIMGLIAQKQDEQLSSKSLEELTAMVSAL